MKLRLFLLSCLGACAPTVSALPTSAVHVESSDPVGGSAALVMVSDPGTPSAPVPYTSLPDTRSAPVYAEADADHQALMAWRRGFIERAVAAGVSRATAQRETANLTVERDALKYDGAQAEFTVPSGLYIANNTGETTVRRAQTKAASLPWLSEIEQRYGVPGEVLVGLWRLESDLGENTGRYDAVNALATLAALSTRTTPERTQRRRADMEGYLIGALKGIDTGRLSRAGLQGSWAGAIGHMQFMPTHILNLGVDADDDGRVDMKNSPKDALFSAAVLLKRDGWRTGEGWHHEVILPANFDYDLVDAPGRTGREWEQLGVRRADGQPWSGPDAQASAVLILPAGAAGPAYLALPNHFVIRKYNGSVGSPNYAMTVGIVADRLRGKPGPSKPWPPESRFRIDEVAAAQRALTAQGFDTRGADGKIGPDTRAAVKAWQRSKGMVADGYLTSGLIAQITADQRGG